MTDLIRMEDCIRACGEMLPEPPGEELANMGFLEMLDIMKAFEPMTEKLIRWGELWENLQKRTGNE